MIASSKLVFTGIGLGMVIIGGLYLTGVLTDNKPLTSDAFYTETISIGIDFAETTNYTIYLPAIMANDSLTPALQNLNHNQMSTVTINDSLYLKISGNQQQFNWSNTVDLPKIVDNPIAYESFLFSHKYSVFNSTQEYQQDNSSLIFINEANQPVSILYTIEATTNLCGIDETSIANSDEPLQLQPGNNNISPFSHTFSGWCT